MSAIQRGLRNPFRNKVRTTVVLILLSVVIGLFAVMVQAALQTQEQLESLQVRLRTLIELREAEAFGTGGFGGDRPAGADEFSVATLELIKQIPNAKHIAKIEEYMHIDIHLIRFLPLTLRFKCEFVSKRHLEKANNSMYILAPVRKLSVTFLSLFLGYAGVAWALEACLGHADHSDHAIQEHHPDSNTLVGHDHSQDPSATVIHCTRLSQQVGPAARVASAEISRPDKGFALHMGSISDAVSASLRNDLWLDAVFRRIVTLYLPVALARHLFLSVLQI
ncbi:MAG: hypothetical protein ACREQW_21675 [Candidatus Binatia bacterium]